MTLRKKLPTKDNKRLAKIPKVGKYRRDPFTGAYESEPHPHVDTWVLIHHEDLPDIHWFPPVDAERVPPETFFVFDTESKTILHMASRDAHGVLVAWESDRDGRYFLRVRKPMWCPRSIELFYDRARVEVAEGKEAWHAGHKDWHGSLSRTEKPDDTPWVPPTRTVRTEPAASPTGAFKGVGGLRRRSEKGAASIADNAPKKALPKVRKSLPKRKPVDDGGILTSSGLDQRKLTTAADDMAGKYANAFPSGDGKKPLKRLRRK